MDSSLSIFSCCSLRLFKSTTHLTIATPKQKTPKAFLALGADPLTGSSG